jgi:hypothetical protein
MPVVPADISPARMARFVQRHDSIERGDEVANDVWRAGLQRELQSAKEGQKVRRERQVTATFHVEE